MALVAALSNEQVTGTYRQADVYKIILFADAPHLTSLEEVHLDHVLGELSHELV